MMKVLVIFSLGFCAMWGSLAWAGSYGTTSVGTYEDWESECSKPTPPSFYVTDVDSYNEAVDEFNDYVSEVQAYVQCVRNEADNDSKIIGDAIDEGVTREQNEAMSEVESAKSDLEMSELNLQ